jgi:drug/metabolite transporter (DMT)-like permease
MVVTLLGGCLLIVAGGGTGGSSSPEEPEPSFWSLNLDFFKNLATLTGMDALGMFVSFLSANFLSMWMIFIKLTSSQSEAQNKKQAEEKRIKEEQMRQQLTAAEIEVGSLSQEAMLIMQVLALTVPFLPFSLIFEDWSVYLTLEPFDWFMLVAFGFSVYGIANYFNVLAIKLVGPTQVSAVLAWRLVATIIFGTILLGESIKNVWQLLGCVIVGISITACMLFQHWQQQKKKKAAKKKAEDALRLEQEQQELEETRDTLELVDQPSAILENEPTADGVFGSGEDDQRSFDKA